VALGSYGHGGIEQSGWIRRVVGGTPTYQFFAEWFACSPPGTSQCPDHTHYSATGSSVGTATLDAVYSFRTNRFQSGDGQVRLEVCDLNTTNCDVWLTADDPYGSSLGWDDNTQAIAYGETHNIATNMPGNVGDKADFNFLAAKLGPNGDWTAGLDWNKCPYNGGGTDCDSNPTEYHFQWVSDPPTSHFAIWTT
jgi:hypothetical protein